MPEAPGQAPRATSRGGPPLASQAGPRPRANSTTQSPARSQPAPETSAALPATLQHGWGGEAEPDGGGHREGHGHGARGDQRWDAGGRLAPGAVAERRTRQAEDGSGSGPISARRWHGSARAAE